MTLFEVYALAQTSHAPTALAVEGALAHMSALANLIASSCRPGNASFDRRFGLAMHANLS